MNQPNVDFISAGANRHPSAADWNPESGILAYASDQSICLWRPLSGRGVFQTLHGHTDVVNVVTFCGICIISGSADNTIRLWKLTGECIKIVNVRHPVNVIASGQGCFASGGAEAEVSIWSVDGELLQSIVLKPKFFPLAIAFAHEPPLLAIAGTSSKIQLYFFNGERYEYGATLTGHEGWIRSLAFNKNLLASSSQDKYTRLWRIQNRDTTGETLSNKAYKFGAYAATFEALLLGHEDWIYTARWHGPKLLTASADNSLAVWEADVESGIWICTVRLGSISTQKGATTATGSTGGFYTGLWSPDGDAMATLTKTGSWRLWRLQDGDWNELPGITGHAREVQALAWARDGSYLLSTSADQTTRLWARSPDWKEYSRPQIHGYNLNCIDSITPGRFVSGADEKLLRVFDEPNVVAKALGHLIQDKDAASLGVLGLSNQASDARQEDLQGPPLEDSLARTLLWPEVEKLYGHGYEIAAVAASQSAKVIATACKATSVDHAVIRVYDTETWQEVKTLKAHSLTVTSLSFSSDDQYLLSTGRDRSVFLHKNLKLFGSNPKAHTRMILDSAWVFGKHVFATAGRDKSLHFWNLQLEKIGSIHAHAAVTSVDVHMKPIDDSVAVAYGLEDGSIHVARTFDFTSFASIKLECAPSKAITSLKWAPSERQVLAAASEDTSVRIYSLSD